MALFINLLSGLFWITLYEISQMQKLVAQLMKFLHQTAKRYIWWTLSIRMRWVDCKNRIANARAQSDPISWRVMRKKCPLLICIITLAGALSVSRPLRDRVAEKPAGLAHLLMYNLVKRELLTSSRNEWPLPKIDLFSGRPFINHHSVVHSPERGCLILHSSGSHYQWVALAYHWANLQIKISTRCRKMRECVYIFRTTEQTQLLPLVDCACISLFLMKKLVSEQVLVFYTAIYARGENPS